MITAGLVAVMAIQGACNRQPQPQAQALPPPLAPPEGPRPVPTAVVYHQAQDRWEVVLAPPERTPSQLLRNLPLQTYTADGIVDGFVPNLALFEADFDVLTGPFPAWIEFTSGQWIVRSQVGRTPEQPFSDEGFYQARVSLNRRDWIYTIWLAGQDVPVDNMQIIYP